MNECTISGKICSEPTSFLDKKGKHVYFTLAVQRTYAKNRKKYDFIECRSHYKTAEFISAYFAYGNMIAVHGHMQTENGSDMNGNPRTNTYILVSTAEFVESKEQHEAKLKAAGKPIPTTSWNENNERKEGT